MTDPAPTNRWAFLRAHGFLVLLLCLLAVSVAQQVAFRDFGPDRYGNLVVGLLLLFQHLAHRYAKAGWQRTAMWTLTIAWLAFTGAYLTWHFSLRAG
jgi:hypothetical protein